MSVYYLENMNTKQVEKLMATCNTVLLPIGPMEVHGYFLPICTDVAEAVELTERMAARLAGKDMDVLIAPPINYAVANCLNCFPGNTTIRPETVTNLVSDVMISFAKWGFTNIFLVCLHAEPLNADAIRAGIAQAISINPAIKGRLTNAAVDGATQAIPYMKSPKPEFEIHATEWEVGMMLTIRPETVDTEELAKTEPNWTDNSFWAKITDYEKNYTFDQIGAPHGYFGDPRCGTAETGDKVLDVMADFAVDEYFDMIK